MLIQFMEVYVGQERAYYTPLWCSGQGSLLRPLFHHTCTQEFPEQCPDVPVCYSLLDRLYYSELTPCTVKALQIKAERCKGEVGISTDNSTLLDVP